MNPPKIENQTAQR